MHDTTCVYPGCPYSRRTRGLCHGHYQVMRSYVRKGQASEADLMRRGLLLPNGTGGVKITTGHDAFQSGSEVAGRALSLELEGKPVATHAEEIGDYDGEDGS